MTRNRAGKIASGVFFAVLLLCGLFCSSDYGPPVDEPSEQAILQENMLEYALRLLGEDSAPAKWYTSQGIEPISQSIERDHGQCAYYLAAALLPLRQARPDLVMALWHAYTWLWFMAGVGAIYLFCRETGLSRPVSCAGMLLLYLCPRFFAQGHYNNKDMVLLSLFLLTLWLGVRFLKRPGFLRGALFSLAGAMAANTKVVGVLPWAVMGVAAIALVTARRRWSGRMAGVAVCAVGLFLGFYALLTPAMWAGPAEYIQYLLLNASGFTRWPGVVIFRGMRFEHSVTPLPRYYLPWMMAVTLPMYVLPLAAAGSLAALLRAGRQKAALLCDPITLALLAAGLCSFTPLLYAALRRPLVYNGWRHFYFAYAGVALLGAHGVAACLRFLRKHGGDYGMHRVFAAGLCLYFAWTAGAIVNNHPYQYAYYNRLGHDGAAQEMELDYWNVSAQSALKTLQTAQRNEELPLVVGARDEMSLLGLIRAQSVFDAAMRQAVMIEESPDAPYLYANTMYANLYSVPEPEGYHALFTLESYGVPVCTVYEREERGTGLEAEPPAPAA